MEIVCFAHAVTQKNHKVSGFAEYILKKKNQEDEGSKNIHSFTALSDLPVTSTCITEEFSHSVIAEHLSYMQNGCIK